MRDKTIRSTLLQDWTKGCILCGYNKKDINGVPLLEGAHVKDYASNNANDVITNMILLCSNHHNEYDHGMIDFDPNGTIHTYYDDDPENGKQMHYYPKYVPLGIIKYHNKYKFKGKIDGERAP